MFSSHGGSLTYAIARKETDSNFTDSQSESNFLVVPQWAPRKVLGPPWKKVVIGFLRRKSITEPFEKQLHPHE